MASLLVIFDALRVARALGILLAISDMGTIAWRVGRIAAIERLRELFLPHCFAVAAAKSSRGWVKSQEQ